MPEELLAIVSRWYATGHITASEKADLKEEYLRSLGYTPGCTICDSFWSDVRHYFFYQLKSLNLIPVKNSVRKYIILGAGFLMLPGQSVAIANEGEETEDRKILTDALAEDILKQYPDYSSLIGINPAWQARQDALAEGESESDESKDSTDQKKTADTPEDQWELQAKYDALSQKYDDLLKEHEQVKNDHSVTKGLLTKANNKLAKATATTPAPEPIPAAVPTNESGVPQTPSTDASKTGAAESAETTPTGSSDDSGSKGNAASDAAQDAIDQAQA